MVSTVRLVVKGCTSLTNMGTSPDIPQTDAYVSVFLDSDCVLQTPVLRNDCSPNFDSKSASAVLEVLPQSTIAVQVWHKATRTAEVDKFLGEALISGEDVLQNPTWTFGYPLHKRRKEPDHKVQKLDRDNLLGSVTVAWSLVSNSTPKPSVPAGGGADDVILGTFGVVEARNVLKRDSGPDQLSDPYFLVYFPKRTLLWKSPVYDCTLNPKVAAAAPLQLRGVTSDQTASVTVEVWNANPKPERDSFLGTCKFTLRSLSEGQTKGDLQPRPKEPEAMISRLEGRLGWVVVAWAPSDEMKKVSASSHQAVKEPLGSAMQLDPVLLNSILSSARPSTAAAPPQLPSQPIQSAQQQHEIASALAPPSQATVVPIQLTDIVPILVADDYGETLYTELRLDSAVGELQPLIQKHFNVHVRVQVLKCNGQLVQPNLSLRRNGCLLLQGEPYVKIHMSVAKGPTLALVFVLPDKREIPLAVAETSSVKRVKEELCAVDGVDLDPKDIRLLWRYNELNDKATLDYYRVVTRTKISVARKPQFFEDGGQDFTDDRVERRRSSPPKRSEAASATTDNRNYTAQASSTVTSSRRRPEESSGRPSSVGKSASADKPSLDKSAKSAASQRPPSGKRSNSASREQGHERVAQQKTPYSDLLATTGRYTVDNRPRAYYEADAAGLDDPELSHLRKQVKQLEMQVVQQTTSTAKQSIEEDVRVHRLERKLEESDRLLMEALSRIAELEGTVRRYQELVNKLSHR